MAKNIITSGEKWRKVGKGCGPDMFIGEYQHNIDDKGRLTIPAKFREELGDGAVLTRGLENCLFLFSKSEWEEIAGKLRALPMTRSDARAFSRFFFSGAAECEFDKQGRIMVPAPLRRYAAIERDVMVVGVSSRVEIWNQSRWEEYIAKAESSYSEIAEQIEGLGI